MTNPGTPAPGGGMPKWLIIVLVAVLVIGIGCCGGVYMCFHVFNKAASTGVAAMQREAEQMQADALKQAADARQRAAAEAVTGGGNGAATPAPGAAAAPGAPGAPGATVATAPGGTVAAPPAAGGIAQALAGALGSGSMPVNFPADVPVMKGLSPTGVSSADKIKGSGMIMMTGTVTHDDAVAFYDKELPKQGWKEDGNQDVMGQTVMTFSKDTRKLTVEVVPDIGTGQSMVNFEYETNP